MVEGLSLAGSSQACGGKGARKWEPHAGWGSRTFEASDKVRANRTDGIILKTREASHIGKAPQGRGSARHGARRKEKVYRDRGR